MKEIFKKRIEEYIESNKKSIIRKIYSKECTFIIENETEYADSLISQFTAGSISVDFEEIDYSEDKTIGYYQDGTPVDVITYTFKVPFKGDGKLLNYRSNKGKYQDKTYFVEDNHIYFKSMNFDLKPETRRFANTIDILKSIISNLNKDYENWNDSLPEFVKSNVKTRKNTLIEFKEFCNKYELSKERIEKMEFKLSALEELSQIIGEIYTGSGITRLFKKAGFPEIVHDGNTKWKFVCETFENMQEESIEGFYKILKVLEVVCDPQEQISNFELHIEVLEKVNRVLSFYGFKFSEDGNLNQLNSVTTQLKPKIVNQIQNEETYDVFISHSSSDKDWVNGLYECLSKTDLKIWYDVGIIKIGDNIREKINDGLINSDYGIVVLSEEFTKRSWTKMEFDALISLMDEGKLLPITHGLDKEKLDQFFKPLSTIHYLSTEKYSTKEICLEIYSKIKGI